MRIVVRGMVDLSTRPGSSKGGHLAFLKTLQIEEGSLPVTCRKRKKQIFIASSKQSVSSFSLTMALCDTKSPRWCYRTGHLDYLEKIAEVFPWGLGDRDAYSESHQILISVSPRTELTSTPRTGGGVDLWSQQPCGPQTIPPNIPLKAAVSPGPAIPAYDSCHPDYHLKVIAGPAH